MDYIFVHITPKGFIAAKGKWTSVAFGFEQTIGLNVTRRVAGVAFLCQELYFT